MTLLLLRSASLRNHGLVDRDSASICYNSRLEELRVLLSLSLIISRSVLRYNQIAKLYDSNLTEHL